VPVRQAKAFVRRATRPVGAAAGLGGHYFLLHIRSKTRLLPAPNRLCSVAGGSHYEELFIFRYYWRGIERRMTAPGLASCRRGGARCLH
jgi:hypothetical protein